jgi:NitT/TauT family transport system substrate-binding protein
MQIKPTRRQINLAGMLAIAAVCTASVSVPAVAADSVTFRLDWKIYGTHAPFFIAQKKGFFKAQGLNVEIKEGNGSSKVVKLMGTGGDTFAFAAGGSTLQGVTRGIPIKSVYGIMQKSPLAVISLAESKIAKPQDLIGKTVSTSGGGSGTAFFGAFLRANAIASDKVQLAALGRGGRNRALMAGKVAGMLGYSVTEVPKLKSKGFKVTVMHFADWGMNTVANGIIVNTKTIKENPGLIKRFLKAITQGIAYAKAHPDEAVAHMHKLFPLSKPANLRRELDLTFAMLANENTKGKPLGWQSEKDWNRTQNVLSKNGLIKKNMSIGNYYTNEFISK